jgi:hypothetical protein
MYNDNRIKQLSISLDKQPAASDWVDILLFFTKIETSTDPMIWVAQAA